MQATNVIDIDGRPDMVMHPAAGAERIRLVCFHGGGGVGGNPEMLTPLCNLLRQGASGAEIACYVPRYRTLGRDGADLADLAADAEAMVRWALRTASEGTMIYLLGASSGGFMVLDAMRRIAADTAADRLAALRGLVLLNPVTDTGPEGFSNRVFRGPLSTALSPQDLWTGHPMLQRLHCLILHGRRDEVIPVDAARAFTALWPADRCRLIEFPASSHGFFNRKPHDAGVADQIRKFVTGTALSELSLPATSVPGGGRPGKAPDRQGGPPPATSAEATPDAPPEAPAEARLRRAPVPPGRRTTIVFLHIPKTAGQTVLSEIRRVGRKRSVSPVRVHTEVAADANLPQGYDVHSGHIDWVDLETLPEDRFAFTIFREPRERIASFYYYLLREAEGLSEEELQTPARTGMRMIRTCSPSEYFFGGAAPWQRFIRDHYDNFYCSYMATRRIRGSRQIDGLSDTVLLDRAVSAAAALDGIYRVEDLTPLETDLEPLLGTRIRLTDNYLNAGKNPRRSRWEQLVQMMDGAEDIRRLEAFATLDETLIRRLSPVISRS